MENSNYYQVLQAIKTSDFKTAKALCFNLLNDKKYHNFAVANLIYINLLCGNYRRAREFSREEFLNIPLIISKMALLEQLEFNYKRAIEYWKILLNEEIYQKEALLNISRLYINMGEYNIASCILESLRYDSNYQDIATLNLIEIYVLEGKYEYALKVLNNIEISDNAPKEYLANLKRIRYIILNCQNKLNQLNIKDLEYNVSRLLENNEDNLIKHLQEKHLSSNDKRGVGYFFKDTDFHELIENVKKELVKYQASYLRLSERRIIELPFEVGVVDTIRTSNLGVINFIGTDNIITMYPVLVSNEFDIENNRSKLLKINGGF